MPSHEEELANLSGDDLKAVAAEMGIKAGNKGDKRIREEILAALAADEDDAEKEETTPTAVAPSGPTTAVRCARKGGVRMGPLPGHDVEITFTHGMNNVSASFVAAAQKDPRTCHFFSPGYLEVQ